jgi:hypothetical protein
MKTQADKSRSEHVFAVGDWVYLKLQPYVQTSLAPRANQKLAFKFFGPFQDFQVIQRVGAVAYKLQLPEASSIHPIFHVSQLKTAIPSSHTVAVLPHALDGLQIPVKILQRRIQATDQEVVPQVLVQWSNLPRSLATWEDAEALRQRFPRAPAWGQAGLRQGENVSIGTGGDQAAREPRRSARERRGNVRLGGNE